jgi:hypothetical protein
MSGPSLSTTRSCRLYGVFVCEGLNVCVRQISAYAYEWVRYGFFFGVAFVGDHRVVLAAAGVHVTARPIRMMPEMGWHELACDRVDNEGVQ